MFDCYDDDDDDDDDEDTTELISFVMTTINPHVLISTYYMPGYHVRCIVPIFCLSPSGHWIVMPSV